MTGPAPISPILEYLRELHRSVAQNADGAVATYIPELARANPDWFGICVVTTDGNVYEVGDSRQEFTIQSISKPFVYGMALEDNSRAEVLTRIGVEPTGDAFNAISLEPGSGRPRNPMINAGAIAAAGMIGGKTPEVRLRRILQSFSLCAGRDLGLDHAVYRSESETGHRNRAIGHLLRNFNILTEPPEPVVDLYFKQCSVSVTCRDLAMMAATLASRGMNPVTRKQAIRGEYVESIVSVMASCGMYDYAGEWLYRIGMPAKSGVAGGVIAVLPGQLGVGVFSPLLDSRGNSVRGIQVCNDLSRVLGLHLFNLPVNTRSVVRLRFSGREAHSSRMRPHDQIELLRRSGDAIQLFQLQGHLLFSTAEVLVRAVLDSFPSLQYLVLDLKHVLSIDESACRLLFQLMNQLASERCLLVFSRSDRLPSLQRYFKTRLGTRFDPNVLFHDNDLALECCENRYLAPLLPAQDSQAPVQIRDYDLLRGLNEQEIAVVGALLKSRSYGKNETMVEIGAKAGEVFFIHRGCASVAIPLANGTHRRLGVFSPGMAFGEVAMLDGAARSALVRAETEVECHLLAREDFEALESSHPRIKIVLLRNMALGIARLLRKATKEIGAFDF